MKLPEDSGTSTSSIVNAEEAPTNAGDSSSSNNFSSEFMFDILKKEKEHSNTVYNNTNKVVKEEIPTPELVTRPLFPLGESEIQLGSSSSSLSRTQWLNLSFADSGSTTAGQPELRIVQQKQQQARKSRRGPRSRSSQYRGVTFYRRTGRWESHIWYIYIYIYIDKYI